MLSADGLQGGAGGVHRPQSTQWDEFFDRWVYGKGLTDWKVEQVSVEPVPLGRTMVGTADAERTPAVR